MAEHGRSIAYRKGQLEGALGILKSGAEVSREGLIELLEEVVETLDGQPAPHQTTRRQIADDRS